MSTHVTFIVPAYNAAETLDETIDSVVAQTVPDWEIVVVDDGSTDNTVEIAKARAAKDSRIRVVQQANQGVSAARNTGLAEARHDWVVHLDSDDWVTPDYLKLMLRPLKNPKIDCVFCRAIDVLPDGKYGKVWYPPERDEFFPVTSQDCPIAIHAALLRKSLVLEVGGWDVNLTTCEDHDLWQRLARTTAEFALVHKALAPVRLRAGSLSRSKAETISKDAQVVIARGHSADPRVPNPDPKWANGMPDQMAEGVVAHLLQWTAGIDLAGGGDGIEIIHQIPSEQWVGADPYQIAESLQDSMSHMGCYEFNDWVAALPRIRAFLEELERVSKTYELTRRTLRHFEAKIFAYSVFPSPAVLGDTCGLIVDFAEPLSDITLPEPVEQLLVIVQLNDEKIGAVHVPVTGQKVSATYLASIIGDRVGAKLCLQHLRTGGWRSPKVWLGTAKLALHPRTLKFGLSLLQYKRRSHKERLRGFALSNGAQLAQDWALIRVAQGSEKITEGPGDGTAFGKSVWFGPPPPPRKRKGEAEIAGQTGADIRKLGQDYWDKIFSKENPWDYTNDYEQTKYHQTLDLLPKRPYKRALELACAEGHFTTLLAPHVDELLATDISTLALERAAQSCAEHDNISYQKLDLRSDPVPGKFDLIVCSEVLYYIKHRRVMKKIARTIREHLEPGGVLLMAHAHVAAIDPEKTGFEWGHLYDARNICDVFSRTPGLQLKKRAETELYEIHQFEAVSETVAKLPAPETLRLEFTDKMSFYVSSQVQWNDTAARRREEVTDMLPILMYHRVSPEKSPDPLDVYRVTPEAFESQIRYLVENGYYGTTLETWRDAKRRWRGLPGRAVALTFDDGYDDFYEYAWPILERYGVPSTMFVVTDHVGGRAEWDSAYGEPASLMSWERLREISDSGVSIGSHTVSHPFLTMLSRDEIARQGLVSKDTIEQKIGKQVTSIAYPYGDQNDTVARIMAECGYTSGVTCVERASRLGDYPLQLCRTEVTQEDEGERFRQIVSSSFPVGALLKAKAGLRNRVRQVQRDYL